MPSNITIGLFDYQYHSNDGGQTWHASERTVSKEYHPVLRGDAELSHIPFESDSTYWRFLYYNQERDAGLAVDASANLYDGGQNGNTWQKITHYRFSVQHRMRMAFRMCWPPEQIDCLRVSQDSEIFLCWEDPWIMSGSKTHLISSDTDAKTWHYRCLGDAYAWIHLSPAGQIVISAQNHLWIRSAEGRNWRKEIFSIDWGDHAQKGLCRTPFQRIGFVSEMEAYAITPTWTEDASDPMANNDYAVLKTEDGGKRWYKVTILRLPKGIKYGNHNLDDLLSINFK